LNFDLLWGWQANNFLLLKIYLLLIFLIFHKLISPISSFLSLQLPLQKIPSFSTLSLYWHSLSSPHKMLLQKRIRKPPQNMTIQYPTKVKRPKISAAKRKLQRCTYQMIPPSSKYPANSKIYNLYGVNLTQRFRLNFNRTSLHWRSKMTYISIFLCGINV